jgi:hypothetical protein
MRRHGSLREKKRKFHTLKSTTSHIEASIFQKEKNRQKEPGISSMPYRHQSKHPKLQNCANIGHTYVAGRWDGQYTEKTEEAGGSQLR